MIDFSWTDEQLKFKQAVIEFAQKELNHGMVDRDRGGELARENWKKCARMGILGLAIPEEYGGSGTDILTAMLVMEGLGYGCRDNVERPTSYSRLWHGSPEAEVPAGVMQWRTDWRSRHVGTGFGL